MNFMLVKQTTKEYKVGTCEGCHFNTIKTSCPKDKDRNMICLEESLKKGKINLIFKRIY